MDNTFPSSSENPNASFPFPIAYNSVDTHYAFHDGTFTELSAALAAAQTVSPHFESRWMMDPALEGTSNDSTTVSSPLTPNTPITRPKLGSRFSREVIRVLKNWLAAHQQHPYPKDDDMMLLQQRTGLNQAQLANWFANARRRGKVQSDRPASPQVQNTLATPIEITQRPGTPAFRQASRSKNPMQRWVDSPPEHEPADVCAIARAMASNSTKKSYVSGVRGIDLVENAPWRSPYAISSASSAGTSHSSEQSAHHSSGSQSSLRVRRPARRKRASRRRRIETDPVTDPNMPYQCTFCTETFKTKYDWQRHEKSLHLPFEQWVCALHGSRAPKSETTELCCVFCGKVAPDEAHIEGHHYTSCQERTLDERTFHRKDHLVQHLRLVHNAKFEGWSMKNWMIPMPDIKSRCGFCGLEIATWTERTDHLADHFKIGATMADWKGDWGFDDAIVRMVESAVPPYFIDYERNTLVPLRASDPPWGSPPNAYELLKIEIEFFIQKYVDTHEKLPTNDAIQLEACRVIFSAEASANVDLYATSSVYGDSWLRDLIMSSPELTRKARFGPIRTSSESRHSSLRINGKDHLFEQCPLETQLRVFVIGHHLAGTPLEDGQLQTEMCDIVRDMEKSSTTPSDMFANWVVKGIYSGPEWLSGFKLRAGVAEVIALPELPPNIISQEVMNEWGSVTHHSLSFLSNTQDLSHTGPAATTLPYTSAGEDTMAPLTRTTIFDVNGQPNILLPDDTNFFRIFEVDIRRWVAATMSPKNPNCHVPSDEEIQHQARWIMYNGDDPWNQTPADYAEWLWRFKRDVGIVSEMDAVNPAELMRNQQ
ncbi:hypothetical protein GQ44DRAFT_615131 [Phaeosphaeriaceae sp. PMI808]|nr:hypothetical protein GQ44DRAFT_615131 [Phaeosphaeriaceae sp. PMI808]